MKRNTTNEIIKYKIEEEGLGYMIEDYTDGSDFEDEKLEELWSEARIALRNIRNYLDI